MRRIVTGSHLLFGGFFEVLSLILAEITSSAVGFTCRRNLGNMLPPRLGRWTSPNDPLLTSDGDDFDLVIDANLHRRFFFLFGPVISVLREIRGFFSRSFGSSRETMNSLYDRTK